MTNPKNMWDLLKEVYKDGPVDVDDDFILEPKCNCAFHKEIYPDEECNYCLVQKVAKEIMDELARETKKDENDK